MTKFTFKVNGVDFSDIVSKYGYSTERVAVYGKTVTTLDGVDHVKLLRSRGCLTIKINPVGADRMAEFCNALATLPVEIKYHSFQLGTDVSETMRLSNVSASFVLDTPAKKWVDGASVKFEQL